MPAIFFALLTLCLSPTPTNPVTHIAVPAPRVQVPDPHDTGEEILRRYQSPGFVEALANPFACAIDFRGPGSIQLTVTRTQFQCPVEIKWVDLGATKWSTKGHLRTVFAIDSGTVYWADFNLNSSGAIIRAYETASHSERWNTHPDVIGPVAHSKYGSALNIRIGGDQILICGEETAGKYVAVLDAKSGRILAAKRLGAASH